MKRIKQFNVKMILAAFIASSAILLTSSQHIWAEELPGKGVIVRPVLSTTLESRFAMEVVDIGLEDLGYDVKDIAMTRVQAGYVAVAQGDAEVFGECWEPNHDKYVEKAGGKDKLEKVGILVDGAWGGYLIDKRTAEKYNITNIGQLKDPKIAKLFDSDGDGRANLAGCPVGWGCDPVINHHIEAYGLKETVQHDQGEFVITHTDVVSRYKAGKPVLYYTYTPLWLNQILIPGKDVVWLEVPFTSFPEGRTIKTTTILPDGRNIGHEMLRIRLVANKKFLEANPVAKKWFELVTIPIEDVNAENLMIFNGEKSYEQIRAHANKWIKDNQETYNSWIREAKKAAN